MQSVRRLSGLIVAISVLLQGCASAPSYEDAFSSSQAVHGSMESIPAPMSKTWAEAMGLLAQQGFIVQQADEKSHIILMVRELRDQKDKDFSYTINATVTFVPLSDEITRVMVAANQSTELHRKEYQWWHLLWLIPLFPIGSNYTTVVVNRDTVRSPQFYHDFFAGLLSAVNEGKEADAPAAPVLKPAPAVVKKAAVADAAKPSGPPAQATASVSAPAAGPAPAPDDQKPAASAGGSPAAAAAAK